LRILVVESLTARAHFSPAGTLPPSLLAEGRAMFDAVSADFALIPGVELLTHLDLAAYSPAAVADLARTANRTLIVAPETDLELLRLVEALEAAGAKHLNATPEGVRIAGDKLALAELLRTHAIPTPATAAWDGTMPRSFPCVLKPRFGAGSQDTFRIDSPEEYVARLAAAGGGFAGPMIVQEFVPGIAASMSIVARASGYEFQPGTRQILSDDGEFHYLGCELLVSDEVETGMQKSIAEMMAILGVHLRGWIGFDMVLSECGPIVIEINPRLTTSYIALRNLRPTNPMAAMLTADDESPSRSSNEAIRSSGYRYGCDG